MARSHVFAVTGPIRPPAQTHLCKRAFHCVFYVCTGRRNGRIMPICVSPIPNLPYPAQVQCAIYAEGRVMSVFGWLWLAFGIIAVAVLAGAAWWWVPKWQMKSITAE